MALEPAWSAPAVPRIARIEQIPCSGCSSIVLCIVLHIEHWALLPLEQASDFDAHQLAFGDIFRHCAPRSPPLSDLAQRARSDSGGDRGAQCLKISPKASW